MRRILILVGSILAALVILYGAGVALLVHGLTRSDPYPTFMTEYQLGRSQSYEEAIRSFPDFVVKTFPIGSNAKDAIAEMTRGGFQITGSGSETVALVWKRQAGPCSEWYSVFVSQNVDGTIAKIIGQLQPMCL